MLERCSAKMPGQSVVPKDADDRAQRWCGGWDEASNLPVQSRLLTPWPRMPSTARATRRYFTPHRQGSLD